MSSIAAQADSVGEALISSGRLFELLDAWVDRGWLRALDRAFVAFLREQAPEASPLLLLAAAFASHQLGRGHVCIDLRAALQDADRLLSLPPEGENGSEPAPALPAQCLQGLTLEAWLAALQEPALVGEGEGSTPLVRVDTRLYLRRYWTCEQQIRAAIEQRLRRAPALAAELPPPEVLREQLTRLFPEPAVFGGERVTDWQKVACALAARSAFTVITGGPGTGKTTTVVRLLALLQSLALAGNGRALRIRLAAPTGKAAARLNESIAGAVARLPLPDDGPGQAIRAAIPTAASTLHRLLGSRPDSRRFRHDRRNPLPVEVLVVDEASMIDVEMMAALLEALPEQARLILLGDKDQLASVEAGAVLGELCRRAAGGHYQPALWEWLQSATGEAIAADFQDPDGRPLDQAVVMLRISHRFHAASGIGRLAEYVNAGNVAGVRQIWSEGFADLAYLRVADETDDALERLAVEGGQDNFPHSGDERAGPAAPVGYQHYLTLMRDTYPGDEAEQAALDAWARAVLDAYRQFQLLCALRKGPWGVEGLNRRIAEALRAQGLIAGTEHWYAGRPVLVTRNDYALGLMNGDIGVTLAVPQRDQRGQLRRVLRVAFLSTDGSNRVHWLLPSRLTAVETVYAMTVHKSQGSEFTHTALVLPDHLSPVVTRELVYTGITRASRWFTLVVPSEAVLTEAVQRAVDRVGGLRAGL